MRLKACVFIGLAVHALIYILLIFKFDLYRGACGGGRCMSASALVVSCSRRLPFKLGDPGSILGRTSAQGLNIIEEIDR